jgi:pimeloyl-ACP methyl ester carboxylesterase
VETSSWSTPQRAPGIPSVPRVWAARLEAAATGRVAGYYAGTVLTPPARRDVSTAEGKAAVSRCHDQIAFERDSELSAAARTLLEWRAHLRTLRFIYVPQLTRQACRVWRVGRARRAQHRPVVSAIPTLVLTGEWDGTVWPREGRRIAEHLRNSFLYEFPGIGHATLTFARDCPMQIAAAFVEQPSTRPDAGCIAQMPRLVLSP